MKVMHFHFGKDGGAERFFVHLVRALGSRGVEQKVVIRPNRAWRSEIEPFAEIKESNFRDASFDRLLLPFRVKALAKKWKPKALFAWMPRACKLMPDLAGFTRIARLGDYPLQLTSFRNIDTLVCNTPGIADHVRNLGWTKRVEVISNFTNTVQAAPVNRQTLNTPQGAKVVATMGRFVPRKGFDVVINAVGRMPDTYLWIIGDGEENGTLQTLTRELQIQDRVRFVGWKPDPRPYLAAADVFAMASSHEPLGNVILEAWSQRIPVVATKSEGPMWFMRNEHNGLMVDIGDAEGFSIALGRILADPTLGRRLVNGGEQTLMSQFSESGVVDSYLKLFSSESIHLRRSA